MQMRAVRRAHRARLKKARRYYFARVLDVHELGKVVDTPKPCSCFMCGNPRRYFGEEHVSLLRWRQPKLHEE
jgi:hypothetical protein